jgi:ABC-type transport system involved in cytochrome bd biosynthesis fused ATPase/permease subunit
MTNGANFLADLIIVLDQGRVAEQGTHEELMQKGGLYYRMWMEQARAGSLAMVDTLEQELTVPAS